MRSESDIEYYKKHSQDEAFMEKRRDTSRAWKLANEVKCREYRKRISAGRFLHEPLDGLGYRRHNPPFSSSLYVPVMLTCPVHGFTAHKLAYRHNGKSVYRCLQCPKEGAPGVSVILPCSRRC